MSHFGTEEAPLRNALVPLAPISQEPAELPAMPRPNADFIAQLIATATQAPQTRARRRATADEATALYGALGRRPSVPGHALSRSL